MNKQELLQAITANGGATLTSDLKEATLKSGYMVSLEDHELKTSIELLDSSLLKEYQTIAKGNNAYIGFWLDNDDLYVDISINIDNINEAIKTAKANKQLAIYNCSKGETIYV